VDHERLHRGDLPDASEGVVVSGRPATVAALVALALVSSAASLSAQTPDAPPTGTPRQSAPIDLTGYWVSVVTEDWRFRMITPPKGDYTRMPLTPEARKVADGWNPKADESAGEQCKAYGAAAIMRVPGRVRITWQDDNTMRVDADAGTQTRLFRFGPANPPRERTWQGHSTARWDAATQSLTVVTTNMRAGYLRRNGVPYSENATVTEHFDVAPHPDGGRLLIVTTIVEDPRFLQQRFIVSSHFRQEKDGTRWNPTPCAATW
jgi:hypothetical protein